MFCTLENSFTEAVLIREFLRFKVYEYTSIIFDHFYEGKQLL